MRKPSTHRWLCYRRHENFNQHLASFLDAGNETRLRDRFAKLFSLMQGKAGVGEIANDFKDHFLRYDKNLLEHLTNSAFPLHNDDEFNKKVNELGDIIIAEVIASSPHVRKILEEREDGCV